MVDLISIGIMILILARVPVDVVAVKHLIKQLKGYIKRF
jgi:hypothetical protein